MMRLCFLFLLGSFIFLQSCASVVTYPLPIPKKETKATLLVYREFSLNAGGVSVIFSLNNKDIVSFKTDNYSVIEIDPGRYEFSVYQVGNKAFAFQIFKIDLEISQNEHRCLRVYPSPLNLIRPCLGIFGSAIPSFELKEDSCPPQEMLKKFDLIPVEYK